MLGYLVGGGGRDSAFIDYVLGDRDGIVIIPAAIAEEVVQQTEEISRTVREAVLEGVDHGCNLFAIPKVLMQAEGKSRKLLRIHRDDNVLIVVAPVKPGDGDLIDGQEVVFTQNVAIGHKVAARAIKLGEKVYKCGVPIGSAKEAIPAGAHIHLHNLKSDYIATYTLDKDNVFVK